MKKTIVNYLLLFSFFPIVGFTQTDGNFADLPCGTEITQEQLNYLEQTARERSQYQGGNDKAIIYIPVQNHVVRRTNGTGGLTTTDISHIMQTLNHYYSVANMQFYECAPTSYINNDTYFNFDQPQEGALAGPNDVSNVINIYYFNSVTSSSGGGLCGYSRFPPSVDRVIMDNSCAMNGSTIVHEIGHYFSLYHTHGKTNTGTTDELVNGSNCNFAGDNICDTPADPNLSGLANTSCEYTGTSTDLNGQFYNPQVNNIMSYSRKSCRRLLTAQQMNRVAYSLAFDRNYLMCNPAAPSTDFAANTTITCDGIVYFNDLSSSLPHTWVWNFGDGSTSNQRNPVHIYDSNGTYTVKLASSNANGAGSELKTSYITVDLPTKPVLNDVDTICENESTLLQGTAGGQIHWFDSDTSTTSLSTGNTFNTPVLQTTTTYYAVNYVANTIKNAAPSSNTFGGGSNFTNKEHLEFDALKPFKLISVKVYANGSKERTFELRNFLGLVLQSKKVFVANGQQTVTLNFDVPAGQDLQLGISVVSEVDLYRNNSGVNYPYTLPGVLSITGSSQGSGYYYFFYDWKVQENDCSSARVPVTVHVKNCGVGIAESIPNKVSLYPNPNKGIFNLQLPSANNYNIEVYNLVGKSILKKSISSNIEVIDISREPSGIYFVKIISGKEIITKKMVIK